MTGFALVRRPLGDAELVLTLKSVNHRALDLHFHTGSEWDPYEAAMRALIKQEIVRGHVSVRISVDRPGSAGALSFDETRLAGYVAAFRSAAARYGIAGEPDLNAAFQVEGMLTGSVTDLPADTETVLLGLLQEGLRALNTFRAREGAEIAAILRKHNQAVRDAAERIEQIRGRALSAFHARLQERLGELLAGANVEPQRLAQEAAVLADRSDIGEEIARLGIHSRQLDELLNGGGEVGKKLDFLLQEMNRETNTILSKTSGVGEAGLGITELALAAKSDIEKIREQGLNLE